MLLKSEITGQEYEVKMYVTEDGKRGICHESLLDILVNKLVPGVSYNTEVLTASETYCAAKCTITDDNCRKVQAFIDVNTNFMEGRDKSQESFVKAHPLISATNSAVDTAVRDYLNWPRVFPPENAESIGSSVVTEYANLPEDIGEEDLNAGSTVEDTETNTKDVPVEKASEEGDIKTAETLPDTNSVGEEPTEESKKDDSDDNAVFKARLAELGKVNAPSSSKYSKMTLEEIWEKYPNWFSYIKNNNKSTTYAEAREYAKLRELLAEKEQQ